MTPVIDPQAVCLRIRELVALRGGITDVARTCGIAKPTLETICAGKNMPAALSLASLSVGLRVSTDWMLFGRSQGDRVAAGEVRQ